MSKAILHEERIVFMGTSEFAETALRAIAKAGYEVPLVVTKVDAQKNRGKKLFPSAVKKAAEELGLKILQPEKLTGNTDAYDAIKACSPDLIVVAEYGKILTKEILELPKFGCINIHASLLPKFRGAAPIQRAILSGDEFTGVTLMKMDIGLDTGDMIAKERIRIAKKNTEELFAELADVGANLLLRTLPAVFSGEAKFEKQDETEATYAQMIEKSEGELDFSKSAEELERQIRAITSYTYYKSDLLKIWQSEVYDDDLSGEYESLPCGSVVEVTKKGIKVKCGRGLLLLLELQLPGKKRLKVADFLNGSKVAVGTVLGSE